MPLINRFPKIGQNTPLTCVFMTGGEYADTARDRLQLSLGSYQTTAPLPHQNSGFGSQRYRRLTGVTASPDRTTAMTGLEEFVIGIAAHTPAGSHSGSFLPFSLVEAIGQTEVRVDSSTGVVSFRRGATILGSSPGSTWVSNQWNWMHYWGNIADAGGFAQVRIGSYSNLILNLSGIDTRNGTTTSVCDSINVQANSPSTNVFNYDEIYVAARSMYFTASTGTAVVGNTLTGPSGTAVITHVFPGCFFVKTVTGSFAPSDALTSPGWTGTASNALSNNEASLWIPEQFIEVKNVSADILTGFTNTTDGGGVHWTQLTDAANTATFMSTNTAAQVDELDTAITLPPGAEIHAFNVNAYARLNGVSAVNNLALGFNDGTAVNDSVDSSILTGAWESHDYISTNNPRTGVKFTTSEMLAATARVTSRT